VTLFFEGSRSDAEIWNGVATKKRLGTTGVAENTPQCVPHVSTCIEKKDREVGPGVEENTSQSLQIISENIVAVLEIRITP